MSTVITTKPYKTMVHSATPSKIVIDLEQGETTLLWAMLSELTTILNNNKNEDTYKEWARIFSRITKELDRRLDQDYDTGEYVFLKTRGVNNDTEDTDDFMNAPDDTEDNPPF